MRELLLGIFTKADDYIFIGVLALLALSLLFEITRLGIRFEKAKKFITNVYNIIFWAWIGNALLVAIFSEPTNAFIYLFIIAFGIILYIGKQNNKLVLDRKELVCDNITLRTQIMKIVLHIGKHNDKDLIQELSNVNWYDDHIATEEEFDKAQQEILDELEASRKVRKEEA